jgi:hypothetical protein
MKILFFLENNAYGRGSANLKAKDQPILQVDLPEVPGSHMEIDGQWYTSKYQPSFHYRKAEPNVIWCDTLDHVEIIIRPNGGEAEQKWHLNQAPFDTEHPS